MSNTEEDKELEEYLHMEREFKKACELHNQYTANVILARLKFQENCLHNELKISEYEEPFSSIFYNLYHCKRCGKLIMKEKMEDMDNDLD